MILRSVFFSKVSLSYFSILTIPCSCVWFLTQIFETLTRANLAMNIRTMQLHFPLSPLGVFIKTFLDYPFIFLIRLGMIMEKLKLIEHWVF